MKKIKQKSLLLLWAVTLGIFSFGLQACSDDDDNEGDVSIIVGTWSIDTGEVTNVDLQNITVVADGIPIPFSLILLALDVTEEEFEADLVADFELEDVFDTSATFTFREDGTFTYSDNEGEGEGTYSLSNNGSTLVMSDGELTATFTVNTLNETTLDISGTISDEFSEEGEVEEDGGTTMIVVSGDISMNLSMQMSR